MEISPQEKDIETNLIPVPQEVGWGDIVNNNGLRPEDGANKRQVFAQAAAPTINYQADDLWFDTDDNNTIYKANSALSWVSLKDGSIAGKITTFRQASVPTALAAGDLWTDTDDDNTYRATAAGDNEISAGEWVQVATLGATFGTDIAGGGSANTQVTNAGYATLFRYDKFGSGADGDKTVSGTETLTSDMNWDNLTIPTGTILNAAGYKIRVKGTLTCAGTGKIINSGAAGSAGQQPIYTGSPINGGAGGAGGSAVTGGSLPQPKSGAAGGEGSYSGAVPGTNGTAGGSSAKALSGAGVTGQNGYSSSSAGGSGGAGGSATGTIYNYPVDYANATLFLDTQPSLTILSLAGGAGGGGGGGALNTNITGGGGGGGGASAGMVWIAAKTIANGLNIEAIGGAGGAGGLGADDGMGNVGANGGAGATGRGGIIVLIYETIGTYTLTVTGGASGATYLIQV